MGPARVTIGKLLRSDRNMKIGNHRLEIQENGERWYYYHRTPIVKHINPGCWRAEVVFDTGGWDTRSTIQNINEYKRQLGI